MKTIFIIKLCIAQIALSIHFSKAQDLTYHIFVGKKHAGILKAQMNKLEGDLFKLHLESNTDFTLVEIYTLLEAEYRNGQLQRASNLQKVNGKVKNTSQITWIGNQYKISLAGEERFLQKNIVFSVAMLYHIEPQGVNNIFSERFGVFCKINKTASNQYELEMPDGKITKYLYSNGICTEMQSDHTLANIRLILQDK
ncbi:MAG: DUF6134 family protein [Saprospiraceae bacterium]|nr:DUF6134 family protein [Saprospiraceae bacterium]